MSGLAFFDTNVLVYAGDASSPEKEDLRPGAVPGGVRVVNPFVS